jgi:hypothetical protein
VVEGQDVVDAVAQGDLLESVSKEKKLKNGMLLKHLSLLRSARNKRDTL